MDRLARCAPCNGAAGATRCNYCGSRHDRTTATTCVVGEKTRMTALQNVTSTPPCRFKQRTGPSGLYNTLARDTCSATRHSVKVPAATCRHGTQCSDAPPGGHMRDRDTCDNEGRSTAGRTWTHANRRRADTRDDGGPMRWATTCDDGQQRATVGMDDGKKRKGRKMSKQRMDAPPW